MQHARTVNQIFGKDRSSVSKAGCSEKWAPKAQAGSGSSVLGSVSRYVLVLHPPMSTAGLCIWQEDKFGLSLTAILPGVASYLQIK